MSSKAKAAAAPLTEEQMAVVAEVVATRHEEFLSTPQEKALMRRKLPEYLAEANAVLMGAVKDAKEENADGRAELTD